jgi:diazepam-binding inhibitor (GABA receptor modulator, acyl-CoA-binding protein)
MLRTNGIDRTDTQRSTRMSDLKAQFEAAAQAAQRLAKKPDNQTLLQLYALYKQASLGDVVGAKPGFGDFVGRAKYEAWETVRGTSRDAAMQQYVALVERLQRAP